MGEPIRNWATRFCEAVRLTSLLEALPANDTGTREVPEYRWIHCCNEGDYRGHSQGPMEMTREVFAAFVRNFRASPQYKAGELDLGGGAKHTGGVARVIQFDYEHASEMPPWEGSIPSTGAPAPAWVLEVELREADGKQQLWALAKLGKTIRAQIGDGGYLWVSIAFTFEGRHWVTGEPIGPVLTSIAFTNHPYMADLEPLAAANRSTSQPPRSAVRSSGEPPEAPGGSRDPSRTGATMDDKLKERICRALRINLAATDEQIGEATEAAATGAGDLGAVLEALGVTASGDALKVIPELRGALAKVEAVAKQLRELLTQEQAVDAAQVAPADAAAAMRAKGFDDDESVQASFIAYRNHLIDAELRKLTKAGEDVGIVAYRTAVTAGRKAFLSKYGIDKPELVHLGDRLVADDGDTQLAPPADRVLPPGGDPGETIDLRGIKGQTPVLKLVTYLTKHEPGFADLSWPHKCARAGAVYETRPITE